MLRALSVFLSDEGRDGPALAAAAALARREDASLDLVCLAVLPMDGIAFEVGPYVLESDRARVRQGAEALAAWARSALPAGLRVSLEILTVPSVNVVGAVAEVARFSDLAVTLRPYGSGHAPYGPMIGEALLFGSRAPVLVVPDADRTDWGRPFRRLAIAWNDSDEATHAVRAALPFLRAATEVDVLVIRPRYQDESRVALGGALLRWLDRQGVEARLSVLERTERRKADILAHAAAERGCEALVMGAYGHSRLREALLGGTTRDMLADVPLPLIMSH